MHKRDSLRSPRRLAMLKRRRVPYALTATRHPVLPGDTNTAEGRLCPECLEAVRLEETAGDACFAHADAAPDCDLESPGWVRLAAAYAIYVRVRLAVEGQRPMPDLARTCTSCGASGHQSLPTDLTNVDITCRHKRRRPADLVLYRGPQTACHLLVVEHMPADLEDRAGRLPGPLVVLRADQALLEPDLWTPVWSAGLRAWRCDRCAGRRARRYSPKPALR